MIENIIKSGKLKISKRLVALMLAGTCSFSLVGCKENNKDSAKSTNNDGSSSYAITDYSTFSTVIIGVIEKSDNYSLFVPGACLEIKDASGKVVAKWVSGTDPYKVTLAPGKYTLTEIIAPDGYICDSESTNFEIAPGENDTVINFTVKESFKKGKR